MKAARFKAGRSDLPAVTIDAAAPRPEPRANELLIRVIAAGVTRSELQWYPTSHTKSGDLREGVIPGHEFSGVIAGAGKSVAADFLVGASVFGMNDWFQDGALAEYCLTEPCFITAKPPTLSDADAASVPIAALTAWQGLFDRAQLQPGERVLVHGGAGSVGAYAVQLARYRGAHVVATASRHNLEFVAGVGAEQVIDYAATRFEDIAKNIDVVFDTVGGETLRRSWDVLSPGGRVVTIAAGEETAAEDRVKEAFLLVKPNNLQLSEIADLFVGGHLRTSIDIVIPLAQTPAAFNGALQGRSGRGKVVVSIGDEQTAR